MKVRAFKRGRRVKTLAHAVALIEAGQWIMLHRKPHHPIRAGQWPVIQLADAVRNGAVHEVKEINH